VQSTGKPVKSRNQSHGDEDGKKKMPLIAPVQTTILMPLVWFM
jgi:hypothetical protein